MIPLTNRSIFPSRSVIQNRLRTASTSLPDGGGDPPCDIPIREHRATGSFLIIHLKTWMTLRNMQLKTLSPPPNSTTAIPESPLSFCPKWMLIRIFKMVNSFSSRHSHLRCDRIADENEFFSRSNLNRPKVRPCRITNCLFFPVTKKKNQPMGLV